MTISVDQRTLRDWHTKAMLPVLGGCALLGLVWNPDISTQVIIMSIGIATIGLSHGAMDHRVGGILIRPQFGRKWPIVFTLSYLALGSAALLIWIAAPAFALVLFLAYSAFHFGSDRFRANGFGHAVSRGAIPLLLPIAFQSDEVSLLFSMVTSMNVRVEPYVFAAGILAAIAVLVTILSAVRRRDFNEGAEIVLLIALNAATPPLIAFTVYFVLLHSVRHIIELAGWLEPKSLARGFRRIGLESLPLTGLLLVAGTFGITFVRVGDLEPTIIQAVFVGLSCLTVPHMVVTYLGEKRIPNAILAHGRR